jgi:hypothetical protein
VLSSGPRDLQQEAVVSSDRSGDAGEKVGVFEAHRWLTPVTVVLSIVLAFVAMIVLTWIAGGSTPFGN